MSHPSAEQNHVDFQTTAQALNNILTEVEKVVLGKRSVVRQMIACLAAGGHLLLEDVPGVGKTTMAMALAKASGLDYKRISFTPDTMPSDVTGFTMFDQEQKRFEYRPGVAMCNLLLADEINRASPKTQSSLLEVMEESMVTVDGVSHAVPAPFMVIATQNPIGFVGTHPLPEAQMDRFLMRLSMGYPSEADEIAMIAGRQLVNPMDHVQQVATPEVILSIRQATRQIHLEESVQKYIVQIVTKTREDPMLSLGASPRASLALMRTAQAAALLEGRNYVIPEDVAVMVPTVLNHRIMLNQQAKMSRISPDELLEKIRQSVKAPFIRI